MSKRQTTQRGRGPDRQKRTMHKASLANLQPIDAIQDSKKSVASRARLDASTARQWLKLSGAERGELIELALQIRRTSE